MKIMERTKKYIKSFAGFVFMLLVIFYLNYYELNPLYEPIYN